MLNSNVFFALLLIAALAAGRLGGDLALIAGSALALGFIANEAVRSMQGREELRNIGRARDIAGVRSGSNKGGGDNQNNQNK